MARRIRKTLFVILSCLLTLALIAGLGYAFTHRQAIQDHFAAAEFDASPRIQEIVDAIELTDSGQRVFFASKPTVEGRETFNLVCSRSEHTEGGHLLGCFSESRIHLFEVDDARLAGIVEVTAAHELLHAAYSRMSQVERETFAQKLDEAYDSILEASPELAERMAVYETLSASQFTNELHSVLGTEVHELPDWLEEHYSRWLQDRSVVVDLFASYHEVFASLQREAEELQQQLETLRATIEQESQEYTASVEQFNVDWESFRTRNDAFEFSDDPEEFYRLRDGFEQRRTMLDNWRASLESRVSEHESLRLALEELGELSSELTDQIDSEFIPPTPEE